MYKTIYFFLFIGSLLPTLQAQFEGDQLFDESMLHEVRIQTALSIGQLSDLHPFFLLPGEEHTYTLGTVLIDGTLLDSVGVRVKGGLSAIDPKKPLKLDFNAFVPGKRFDGLKKINLQQGNMEESYLREAVAYNILRLAGVKAPRTSFAKVYYNDVYQGVYTLAEQIDDLFIKNRYASNQGTLYKTGYTESLEVKYEIDHSLSYPELVAAISAIPTEQLHEELPNYLDIENFLRFFACQIFINAADSPIDVDYNYYMYFEPKSATYSYVPWDFNLCLYQGLNYPLLPNSANFLFNRAISNEELKTRYLDLFCEQLSYNFEETRIQNLITSYVDLLNSEIQNDPFIDEIGDWETGVNFIRTTISQRYAALNSELASLSPNCQGLTTPIQGKDIVINEIVVSNDSLSGITDPAGGFSDWIELYNNTNNDISLQNFYLSNDKDVLKHWRFPKDVVLLANDYLIIWADRDIDEMGLHTDFKLNKTKGELYLSYENGDLIDALIFENQNTNQALARVPNGTGDFVVHSTTFGMNNDVSQVNENLSTTIQLFPNPTKGECTLQLEQLQIAHAQLELRDINGRLLWEKPILNLNEQHQETIPMERFAQGLYVFICTDMETGQQFNQRIVRIK